MYFSHFPLVDYIYKNNDGILRKKLAVNILKRVGFDPLSKKDKDHFITYHIKNGETPEIIADKLYNNPEMHWLILLFNNTVNPYKDWPLDNLAMDKYIDNKYQGYSLFITDFDGTGHPNTINFYKDQTVASSNATRDAHGIYNTNTQRARVSNWDTQTSRLEIYNTIPETWAEDEFVLGIGSTGEEVIGKIKRFTLSTEAVHHFERQEDGSSGDYIRLNPLGSSEQTGQIALGATGVSFGLGGTEGSFAHTAVTFEDTLIGKYMGVGGSQVNNNVVTNREYEYRVNDDKKEIELLDPKYVSIAIRELKTLLDVKGSIT
jgi:hypothetical protein